MATRTFIIRTTDQAWIARNDGVDAGKERTAVQVPADQTEEITIMGKPWIRHRFTDVPKDCPNGSLLCPVKWLGENGDADAMATWLAAVGG